MDASVLVGQISLSPSSGGAVFQEGSGLAQMAPGTQVQLRHRGRPSRSAENGDSHSPRTVWGCRPPPGASEPGGRGQRGRPAAFVQPRPHHHDKLATPDQQHHPGAADPAAAAGAAGAITDQTSAPGVGVGVGGDFGIWDSVPTFTSPSRTLVARASPAFPSHLREHRREEGSQKLEEIPQQPPQGWLR